MTANCITKWVVLIGVGLGTLCPTEAHAACNDGIMEWSGEQELWDVHGCWREYFLWEYNEYQMMYDKWGSSGFKDACNINKPFAKAWNASFLHTSGLHNDEQLNQWHSTRD